MYFAVEQSWIQLCPPQQLVAISLVSNTDATAFTEPLLIIALVYGGHRSWSINRICVKMVSFNPFKGDFLLADRGLYLICLCANYWTILNAKKRLKLAQLNKLPHVFLSFQLSTRTLKCPIVASSIKFKSIIINDKMVSHSWGVKINLSLKHLSTFCFCNFIILKFFWLMDQKCNLLISGLLWCWHFEKLLIFVNLVLHIFGWITGWTRYSVWF